MSGCLVRVHDDVNKPGPQWGIVGQVGERFARLLLGFSSTPYAARIENLTVPRQARASKQHSCAHQEACGL